MIISSKTFQEDSSAAVKGQNTYSAEELAKMYMTSRADFLGLDFEEVTLNWNPNFIFDFLYHVRELKDIELALEWFEHAWKDKHHFWDSFDRIMNKELADQSSRFIAMLHDIKRTLIQRFDNEKRKQSLIEEMLVGFRGNMTTTAESPSATTSSESTETESPQFAQQMIPDIVSAPQLKIPIESLPENVRKNIVVSQHIFDIFVRQLNEDTWLIVEQNKGKYSDALRFLCNYHHILSRNTTREIFDDLLHNVVEKLKEAPSLMSSMGRRTDTSTKTINNSYKYYASPVATHRAKIWKLAEDCEPLEESLQPVLAAMEAEKAIRSHEMLTGH